MSRNVEVHFLIEREYEETTFEIELFVEAEYIPGYEPMRGIGSDHPAYGDPGCGPEVNIQHVVVNSIRDCTNEENPRTWLPPGHVLDEGFLTPKELERLEDRVVQEAWE